MNNIVLIGFFSTAALALLATALLLISETRSVKAGKIPSQTTTATITQTQPNTHATPVMTPIDTGSMDEYKDSVHATQTVPLAAITPLYATENTQQTQADDTVYVRLNTHLRELDDEIGHLHQNTNEFLKRLQTFKLIATQIERMHKAQLHQGEKNTEEVKNVSSQFILRGEAQNKSESIQQE